MHSQSKKAGKFLYTIIAMHTAVLIDSLFIGAVTCNVCKLIALNIFTGIVIYKVHADSNYDDNVERQNYKSSVFCFETVLSNKPHCHPC